MNFLPHFNINIYPFGNFFIPFYTLITTYAIFKLELFDVKVPIKKSIIYSTLALLISIAYIIIVLLSENILKDNLGYKSIYLSICASFLIGLIFFPLRNKIQELTDRHFFKGTQEEIALQNVQLRQEIAQSEKYKTLGTLASGVAHEIKNPLTAIRTFCEYLPDKLDDKEFLKKFSRIVGQEVDRIDELVHQLLNYGKPSPLNFKKVNIHKHLKETVDILNNRIIEKKIHFKLDFYDDPDLTIFIDPNQIRQAVMNLLLNAIEALPNGGNILIKTTFHASRFTIHITDTGPGIPKQNLKQIFNPFFTTKDSNTGLGLSITQGIIENHGGKLTAKSAVGEGTTFAIELPIHQT